MAAQRTRKGHLFARAGGVSWAGLLGWAGAALLALGGAGLVAFGAPASGAPACGGLAPGVPLYPDAIVGGDDVGFPSVGGDFNGDGRPDLVEDVRVCGTEVCYRALAVHLGRGDGTFFLPTLPPPEGGAHVISAGILARYPCVMSFDSLADIRLAADLDGDGADDLLAVGPEQVLTLRSRRDGCFEPARAFEVGTGAMDVTAADLSGDGALDLAVPFSGWPAHTSWPPPPEVAGGVTILLGDGSGGFGERADLPVSGTPYTIAAADLDADGRRDLALVDLRSDEVAIFRGLGGAAFSPGPRIHLGRDPRSILAGDFNDDGRSDLAVRHAGSEILYLLLSQADGALAVRILSVATGQPGDPPPELPGYTVEMPDFAPLAGGDLNRDGRLDLAVPRSLSGVAILLGRGDGTFDPARVAGNAAYSRVISIRDFDGDGKADLAAADFDNPVLLRGHGDGLFGGALRLPVGSSPRSLAVADFNRDGRPDVAVANSGENYVSILLSAGRGFSPQRRFEAGAAPVSIAAADLSGDGIADLAISTSRSGDVSILLGRGEGSFASQERLPVGDSPGPLRIADVNGDGRGDLLLLHQEPDLSAPPLGRLTFLPGRGDGSFGEATQLLLEGRPGALAGGDFNRDGRLDLAVLTDCLLGIIAPPPRQALPPPDPGPQPCRVRIHVLIGGGAGTFDPSQLIQLSGPILSLAAADLRSDGIPDLIEVEGAPRPFARVRAGLGDGTFALSSELFPLYPVLSFGPGPGIRPTALPDIIVADADLNADGLLDAAFANRWESDVSVLAGDGSGLPGFEGRYLAGTYPVAAASADFDGDGRIDLAVANLTSGDLSVLFNQGPFPRRAVGIDVKPGDATNAVHPGAEGALPVAILGEATFDATRVDSATIRLAGAGVKREGREGRPLCRPVDVNGDGFSDLLCQLLSREMTLDLARPVAVLEACSLEGVPLRGEDTVRIVGPR